MNDEPLRTPGGWCAPSKAIYDIGEEPRNILRPGGVIRR